MGGVSSGRRRSLLRAKKSKTKRRTRVRVPPCPSSRPDREWTQIDGRSNRPNKKDRTPCSIYLPRFRSISRSPIYGWGYLIVDRQGMFVQHVGQHQELTCSWIPKVFRKKADTNEAEVEGERKWILKGVECTCSSGEVLAM
jgi:hypothetical protein